MSRGLMPTLFTLTPGFAFPIEPFTENETEYREQAANLVGVARRDHLGLVTAALVLQDISATDITQVHISKIMGPMVHAQATLGAWEIGIWGRGADITYRIGLSFQRGAAIYHLDENFSSAEKMRAFIGTFEKALPAGKRRPQPIRTIIDRVNIEIGEKDDLLPRVRVQAIAAIERCRFGQPAGFTTFSVADQP